MIAQLTCNPALAALSIHGRPIAQIQSPESIRNPSVDNPRQWLASDICASDHSHLQKNTALWGSQARSGIMEMHQIHGPEEIASISQNQDPVDQDKGSQYQVAGSPVIFETHPVLNPLPPFFDNNLSSSTTWGQIHPLSQLDTHQRDWSSPYSDRNFEAHIAQSNDISQPVSNPLPPIGSIPDFAQPQWLLSESQYSLEDFAIIESLSNPLPPFDSRSENFLFQ